MSKRIKIADFVQDDRNFNRHTAEGMALLGNSIEKFGALESVTVSADDKIISGNARQEKFIEVLGKDVEPIVVETDGTRPVILKRTDIKSGTKEFTEAAILANTTAKKNIDLDVHLMEEVAVDDFDIDIQALGVDVMAVDYSEIDGLSENSLREQINSSGQVQLSFLFAPEHREVIERYMQQHGKKALQNELLKIMQNA